MEDTIGSNQVFQTQSIDVGMLFQSKHYEGKDYPGLGEVLVQFRYRAGSGKVQCGDGSGVNSQPTNGRG